MAAIDPSAIWPLIEKHRARAEDERREWDQYDSWLNSEYWEAEQIGESQVSQTVSGTMNSADDDLSVQTNYPYAFIDTMIANVCPSNPQMTIAALSPEYEDVAQANEDLVNATMRRNKLHDLLWENSMHASVSGRGILRTVWNEDKQRPITWQVDPRAFFYDMTGPWEFTRYVCEAVLVTEAEWKERAKAKKGFKYNQEAVTKVTPAGFPKWLKKGQAARSFREDDASREHFNWVVIYEFYDLAGGWYYHFAEDVEEPLLKVKISDVFKHMKNPYTLVIFNKSLRENSGVSDIKLIASSQRRLNELDSLELQHVHTSIPIDYVNMSKIDNPSAFTTQINSGLGPNDIVALDVREGVSIQDVIMTRPATQLSGAHGQMRERVVGQIEFTLGIPAYSRGKVGTSEVATELALADTATRTRNGRRIKIVGDAVVDVGMKYGALWLEHIGDRKFPARGRQADIQATIVDQATIDPEMPEGEVGMWEDTWWFEMEAVPFSPAENHKLVQLNKLQTFLQPMAEMPNIDNRGLAKKLLELLGFDDIFQEAAPEESQELPGQPQPPEGPEGVTSGGMPEGSDVEDLAAVTSRDLNLHPQN